MNEREAHATWPVNGATVILAVVVLMVFSQISPTQPDTSSLSRFKRECKMSDISYQVGNPSGCRVKDGAELHFIDYMGGTSKARVHTPGGTFKEISLSEINVHMLVFPENVRK